MLKKSLIWLIVLFMFPSFGHAVNGAFEINNDTLIFPDGSTFKSAPKDGKSILSGSGTPSIIGNIGDFYIDTTNNRLYGPYAGSWGTGVSLIGPQGIKGDTGAQGIQGSPGASTGTTLPVTSMNYMTQNISNVIPGITTTDINQILSFYGYSGGTGNIYGYSNNIGMQFTSGTTSGLVVFYFLQYLATGHIDSSFSPLKIAGGRWTLTTINGTPAILVNAAAVRYAMPDIYFTTMNGNLTVGEIVPGPAITMPQTALVTATLVSNKTVSIAFPTGKVTAYLASTGFASGTDPSGKAFSNMPWTITGDGKLTLNNITLKIVGASANAWIVTYTNTKYSVPTTELGPVTMTINGEGSGTATDTTGALTMTAPTSTDNGNGTYSVSTTVTYAPPAGMSAQGVVITITATDSFGVVTTNKATLTSGSNSVTYTIIVAQSAGISNHLSIVSSTGEMASSVGITIPAITPLSASAINFIKVEATAPGTTKTTTISGGIGPYTLTSSSTIDGVLAASLSGNILMLKYLSATTALPFTTQIAVRDASGSTLNIPVSYFK